LCTAQKYWVVPGKQDSCSI